MRFKRRPGFRPKNNEIHRAVLALNHELAQRRRVDLSDLDDPRDLPLLSGLLADSTFSPKAVERRAEDGVAKLTLRQRDVAGERAVKSIWPFRKLEDPVVDRVLEVHHVMDWGSNGFADEDELADIVFDGSKIEIVGASYVRLHFRVSQLLVRLGEPVPAGKDTHWDI
jgi:hypothetical protein